MHQIRIGILRYDEKEKKKKEKTNNANKYRTIYCCINKIHEVQKSE